MSRRSELIAQRIAARITQNQNRLRWRGLHQDALDHAERELMSEQHNIQHPKTDAQIAEQKKQERAALLARIAELEQRVAALEAR